MRLDDRDLRIESLRATLQQARETLTAKPCDAALRLVERLRGELVAAIRGREARDRQRERAARRKERGG